LDRFARTEDEGGGDEDSDEHRDAGKDYAEQVTLQLGSRLNHARCRCAEHSDEDRDRRPFRGDREAREQARENIIRDPAVLPDTDCEEERGEHEDARVDVGADDL
jgi:hypothetical protein